MAGSKLILWMLCFFPFIGCNADFEKGPAYLRGIKRSDYGFVWYESEKWIDLTEEWCVKVIQKKDYKKDMYLSLGGQFFYIYSNMDNDVHFKNHELDFEFMDLNGDGCLDLFVSGAVNYTGKVDYEIYEQEHVVFIYLCNLVEEKFELKFKKASFDLEVKDSSAEQWWKRYKSTDVLDSDRYAELRDLDEEKTKRKTKVQRNWHYSSGLAGVSKEEATKLFKAAKQPSEPGIVKNIYLNEGENTNSSSRGAEQR